MGRELKRVPLKFNAPLKKVWKGYINPWAKHCHQCEPCDGSGLNPETKKLSNDWYSHLREDGLPGWSKSLEQAEVEALVKAGRLMDFTRVPITPEQHEIVAKKIADGGNSWLPFDNGYIPSAIEVNIWAQKGMGHDSINQWICVEARAKRLGVYGYCGHCKDGYIWESKEHKVKSNRWRSKNPLKGVGYQLWETTSEGSPISPVFKTLEELCEWCEVYATVFGSNTASKEEWFRMLAPDGMVMHKDAKSGIVFI